MFRVQVEKACARREYPKAGVCMIQIFTDNAANLPEALVERYGLGVVTIHCFAEEGELDFSGGFDGKKYYDDIRAGMQVTTSMPSMGAFLDAFTPVLERGDDLIYIGLSGGVSGTAALAESVAEELREEYPERRIEAVDTRGASLGEGFHALRAAKLRDEGKSFDEILEAVKDSCDHMWQVFTVDDLAYLRKTGRLFSAAVKVTNLLNVKPILVGDENGHIVLRNMNIGRRRALDTLASAYRDKCADKTAPVGIAHADSPEDTQLLIDKLRANGCTGEILDVVYEPVTGAHVGPGTVALFFFGDGRP